jgi:hypothetical protein
LLRFARFSRDFERFFDRKQRFGDAFFRVEPLEKRVDGSPENDPGNSL